jgi:hypothetical protein
MNKAPARPWTIPAVPKPATGKAVMPLTEHHLRAIGAPPPQPQAKPLLRPYEWIDNLPITRSFVAAMLKQQGADFAASPGQREMISELTAQFDQLEFTASKYSSTATNQRFWKQSETIADASEDVQMQTKQTMHAEANARRHALKEQMLKINRDIMKIATEICKRLERTASDLAEAREKHERAECVKFGVEFQPSVILVTAWQASWRLTLDLPDPILCNNPRYMLAQLPINLK